MNVFDEEFESIKLLKQVCEQCNNNEDLLENLKLLKIQQDVCLDFLNITIKQLTKDAERTEKKIDELATVIKNRSRRSDSYYREFKQQEKN